jgi:hypothetical protein
MIVVDVPLDLLNCLSAMPRSMTSFLSCFVPGPHLNVADIA